MFSDNTADKSIVTKVFLCHLTLVVLIASACAISKRKNDRIDEDPRDPDASYGYRLADAGDRSSTNRAGGDSGDSIATAGTGDIVITGGSDSRIGVCGDGVVEGIEECDYGDLDSRIGCTMLCEYACRADDDCDDLNSCNGAEICTNDHACDESAPDLADGTPCDVDKSCWRGLCVPNVCGDGIRNEGEACDDSNLDPDDGCTPDCEFTCENDLDCAAQDECLGDTVCQDDGRHGGLKVCVGGTELEDGTDCAIKDATRKALCGDSDLEKDGWCINGVCTCMSCGDGSVEGIEECDDGSLNGTTDSQNSCSIDCRVVACGDAELEGNEECDDGNDQRLDGCDPECRYELAHRFTSLRILKDVPVPDWCVHRNNRLAEAFPEEVLIMGTVRMNILDTVNEQLSRQATTGDNYYILHILDSSDTSTRTSDDEITIGFYRGFPYFDRDDLLDLPFVIQARDVVEETLLPAPYHSIPAAQIGGGKIFSREPTTVEMNDVRGKTALMYDFMLRQVFDLSTLSTPRLAPAGDRDIIVDRLSDIDLPEVVGPNPMGIYCGAIESPEETPSVVDPAVDNPFGGTLSPMSSFCCKNRGSNIGEPYRLCESGTEEVLEADCESTDRILSEGCTVCLEILETPLSTSSTLPYGASCELMKTDPGLCYTVIKGIEYDVDSDGDGKNDSWSALFGFESQRVRIMDASLR